MKPNTDEPSLRVYTIPNVPTWRYLGERTSADGAYCARFNVQVAPEPIALANGVWAYTLPE